MERSKVGRAEILGIVVVIVALAGGVFAWLSLGAKPASYTHDQIRRDVQKVTDVERLQTWAQELLNGKDVRIPNNGAGWLPGSDMRDLPELVRDLKPRMILISAPRTPKANVMISWRNDQGDYGLMIGPPRFTTGSTRLPGVAYEAKLWHPGVYTWVEK